MIKAELGSGATDKDEDGEGGRSKMRKNHVAQAKV